MLEIAQDPSFKFYEHGIVHFQSLLFHHQSSNNLFISPLSFIVGLIGFQDRHSTCLFEYLCSWLYSIHFVVLYFEFLGSCRRARLCFPLCCTTISVGKCYRLQCCPIYPNVSFEARALCVELCTNALETANQVQL